MEQIRSLLLELSKEISREKTANNNASAGMGSGYKFKVYKK